MLVNLSIRTMNYRNLGLLQPSESEKSQESEAEEADSSRMENLHWCTCGECCIMPSLIESKCFRECPNLLADKLDNIKCIAQISVPYIV